MKKFLKIFLITIVVLFALLLILPFAFKGKIMKIAKQEVNSSLNAKADFDRLSVSLIRNFPNVSIGIKNLYIAGINEFEGDTLFKVRSMEITLDLVSAIKMENIKIKRIVIDDPGVHAWILPSGKVNWDIMKSTGEEETDTTASTLNPKIELKRFEINHANIAYDDDSSKMSASLSDCNLVMTGDLSQDFTNLTIDSKTRFFNFVYGGIRYLKNASLTMKVNVDADLKNSVYTLKDNSIGLNDLMLHADGKVSMPNATDIDVDLKYALEKADFKSLLSLVPAIYMKDFQDVKTAGKLRLDGSVKGVYNEKSMPNVALNLLVENAMFKYPDLPKSADHIGIDVNLFFDGVQNDNSTVDVNKFHVELGGNPIDMTLNIKTPVSDMHVNGNLNMDINLATLNDVIPLDSTTLTGEIKAGLDFMGNLSYIENGQYDKFKADGSMEIKDFVYSSPDLPRDLRINNSLLLFSPQYLDVKNFDAVMGKSDVHFSGKLEDFLPYIFKNETIRGNFIFTSGVLDLNEFMTESTEPAAPTDTTPLSLIEVPGNIDFKLISRIDKLFYDKLEIDNTVGTILVKDSKVTLDGLSMNLLDGSMQLSGNYDVKDVKNPSVDFSFKAQKIDIPSAFNAFSMLQKFAPIAKQAVGKVSVTMNYSSYLDQHMMPVMNSVVGKGNFTSDEIGIKSSKTFDKIGDALKTKAFDNMVLYDLSVDFEIKDGRVYLHPFETKMGNTTLLIGGDQGLDQTMNYTVGISIPRTDLGEAANAPIDNLIGKASSAGVKIDPLQNLNIKAKVEGTFKDPKIKLDLKESSKQGKQELKDQATQAIQEQIDAKKEQAKAAAKEQGDKIIADAQKEADNIKQKAADAADVVRKQANDNADNLIKKAGNDPIKKKLAESAAKKMRQEGEESAQKIIKEGNEKADAVMKAAQDQADKLLQ